MQVVGKATKDIFRSNTSVSVMRGPGFHNLAKGFGRVDAFDKVFATASNDRKDNFLEYRNESGNPINRSEFERLADYILSAKGRWI